MGIVVPRPGALRHAQATPSRATSGVRDVTPAGYAAEPVALTPMMPAEGAHRVNDAAQGAREAALRRSLGNWKSAADRGVDASGLRFATKLFETIPAVAKD